MKKFIKKNIKIILGFILGLIWSGGIVYAAANGYLFNSDEVSYDNTASGLESTNVQSALDELYVESTSYQLFEARLYPVGAYFETSDSSFNPNTNSAWEGTWTKETIISDHITAQGTSGIFTYRKWSSGIAEIWGLSNVTANSTAGSTAFPNTGVSTISFPFAFNDNPLVFTDITEHPSWWASAPARITCTQFNMRIAGDVNNSTKQAQFYTIGLWKAYTAPTTIYRWHRTA